MFNLESILRGAGDIIIVVISYIFLNWFWSATQKKLLKDAKTKKEKSNIKIFFQTGKYILVVFLIIFSILSYTGSLAGIGLTAGLLSAALGWALQRPITGMAAWLMVVIKRPFEIGDRVIIEKVKGDVVDITLTHIHIKEIGGTIASEETSGRIILIPNSKLFEQDITNYTQQDELILDQVKFIVTFNSDIDKAENIAKESAKAVLGEGKDLKKEPYIRTYFQQSGIDIIVRYYISASNREEISSKITKKIFNKVIKSENINFAYPHTEVILNKNNNNNN